MGKPQRQHAIERLLGERAVGSQSALVELLAGEGIEATQATVSRDLDELGAVKVRVSGRESVYAIPEVAHHRHAPDDHLRRVLSDWVVSVVAAPPLVVLKTPPGSAHVVASALDRSQRTDVAGTVAGDDTLFIAVSEVIPATALADELRELAGL